MSKEPIVEIHSLQKKYGLEQIFNGIDPYKNQVIRLIMLLILLVAVSLIPHNILFDQANSVCVHHHLFGFQCPLCGMTRAVHQAVHLQIGSAIHYNMVIVLLPFYFVMDVMTLFIRSSWLLRAKKIMVVLIFVALLLLYAFRIYKHFWEV